MQQFKSVEDYKTATPIQLVKHLISEIKAIKNDEVLQEYLDFNFFQRRTECGPYYCLAAYISIRSGIPMQDKHLQDKHTGQLTKDFLAIFNRVDGYYSKALCPSTDSYERELAWRSIFGRIYSADTLEKRLMYAEEILEDLKQKEK